MKNFALICLVAGLPALAFAGPDTCEWAGMNTWTFASGSTGYIFSCGSSTTNHAAASAYAETKCQAAWNSFAHSYSATGYFDTNLYMASVTWDPNLLQWRYVCQTCIDGYPPAFPDHQLARVPLSQAVDNATEAVPGEVMAVEYREARDGERAHYRVDVWGVDGMVEVRVDGLTGRASTSRDTEAICRAP